ncbi:cytochrome b [Bradyrhizobium sp. USDA 4454]
MESAPDPVNHVASSVSSSMDRFDRTSIVLHWLTVFLIVVQFTTIWGRELMSHHDILAGLLLSVHRSSGLLIWLEVVVRLIWRRYFAYLPPFPSSMPNFQRVAAKANEYGLYILLLAMPLTGIARTILLGQPFNLLFWQVPTLVEPDPALRGVFAQAHDIGATALMVLIGLHAGAALFHRLVLGDDVMQRMLPMGTGPRLKSDPAE